ncbi:transcriptional regulator [Parvularcula dongshanensis]|uniref:DNA-binding MarR family transcriptional regulator n=1 Tax=Parvularcula dongshanensis TaxID=1173995 RepID=A0A840HZC9_9PROT|nr:DNA-binding MarR family transcriptional regulator [Parvularcula dongshanensis]
MSESGFDANAIDETIHGRVRLGIMAYLAQSSPAAFTELAQVLETTNGNLSVHLTKLEGAGYVAVSKRFEGKKPLTEVTLTEAGAAAWSRYLDTLRALF